VNTPHSALASRILIADPDADVRASFRQLLTLEGRDILDAADGRDALVKALVRAPHLVIIELDLPFVDGFSLCDIFRHDPQTRDVPILVVTHEHANVVRAERCGADVVLVKPLDADAIRRTTSLQCPRAASRCDTRRATSVASTRASSNSGITSPVRLDAEGSSTVSALDPCDASHQVEQRLNCSRTSSRHQTRVVLQRHVAQMFPPTFIDHDDLRQRARNAREETDQQHERMNALWQRHQATVAVVDRLRRWLRADAAWRLCTPSRTRH